MSGTEATIPQDPANAQGAADDKGKGKAPAEEVPQDTAMEEDDDDDDDSSDDEENDENAQGGDDGDDGMEEIDLNNIVDGGRTRGQQIDFAKAAEDYPADDDEDDDDDDFTPPDEDTNMSG